MTPLRPVVLSLSLAACTVGGTEFYANPPSFDDADVAPDAGVPTGMTSQPLVIGSRSAPRALPRVATCGNGRIDSVNELCDDGNRRDRDGCAGCLVERGFACFGTPSRCRTICGDGLIAFGEPCDDANGFDGDGCSRSCAVEHGFFCTNSPSWCVTTCGDGLIGGREQCDDGARVSSDGCSATCALEPNAVCQGEPSRCAGR